MFIFNTHVDDTRRYHFWNFQKHRMLGCWLSVKLWHYLLLDFGLMRIIVYLIKPDILSDRSLRSEVLIYWYTEVLRCWYTEVLRYWDTEIVRYWGARQGNTAVLWNVCLPYINLINITILYMVIKSAQISSSQVLKFSGSQVLRFSDSQVWVFVTFVPGVHHII